MQIGHVFETKSFGKAEVIKCLPGQRYVVQFKSTGSIVECPHTGVRSGSVKDPMAKTVNGVGFIGGKSNEAERPIYRRWHGMIDRCYNESSEKYKYYGAKGVRVADEWHNFQNYKQWFKENFKHGLEIDKDLLGGDSPFYGPNCCVCITSKMNKFCRTPMAYKEMQEVSEVGNREYYVTVRKPDGYSMYLGLFDDPTEALMAYSDVKHSYFVDLLKKEYSKGLISKRTYEKLSIVSPALFFEKAQIS